MTDWKPWAAKIVRDCAVVGSEAATALSADETKTALYFLKESRKALYDAQESLSRAIHELEFEEQNR